MEKDILSIFQQIHHAMVQKDTSALGKILDNNYTLTHITGYKQSKQEWLDQIQDEQMRYFDIQLGTPTITSDGNTATIHCDTDIDARIYGMRNLWRLHMEMHFEQREKIWVPIFTIATSQ